MYARFKGLEVHKGVAPALHEDGGGQLSPKQIRQGFAISADFTAERKVRDRGFVVSALVDVLREGIKGLDGSISHSKVFSEVSELGGSHGRGSG